jgi:hypothetical protein
VILPISASQVSKITGMSHHTWRWLLFNGINLFNNLNFLGPNFTHASFLAKLLDLKIFFSAFCSKLSLKPG